MNKIKSKQSEKKLKKNVAVLFSSGLDSTYLMYKNLEDGNNVLPIYAQILNNENKTKIEKQNVKMLYHLFHEKYSNQIERPLFVSEVNIHGSHDLMFKQLPIWIFSILYLPFSEIDEIQIAYVMNDDAISYIDDIKKLFRAHKFLHRCKQPKLVFPLTKIDKGTMMDRLPDNYKQYMTSCECPELLPYHMKVNKPSIEKLQYYRPCGNCVPCQRIIKDRLRYNSIYSKMINDYYDQMYFGSRFSGIKQHHPEIFEDMNKFLEERLKENYSNEVIYSKVAADSIDYDSEEK